MILMINCLLIKSLTVIAITTKDEGACPFSQTGNLSIIKRLLHFVTDDLFTVKHLKPKSFGDYINPGIRAQLLNKRTGELEMDFVVEYKENSTHILNSVSPAFTTALTFTEFVVDESEKYFD